MFAKRAQGDVLVVDLDDVSVGVSLATLASKGPAVVVAHERRVLPLEARETAQSLTVITKALEEATAALIKKHPTPGTVHVVLRAPWTRFRTVEASDTYDAPRTITKELIPSIAQKALAEPSELDRANIIETGVMHVALNGYSTADPIGKKAKMVSVVAFEGDANAEIQRTVTEIFSRLLPGRSLIFRSGLRALLIVLREHISEIHRYVILDIGGGTSTCAVVRKEAVTQSASAAVGWATIVRTVAGSGVPEEILTNLRLLANDACSTDACIALKDSLAKAEPELAKKYGEMFTQLAARRRMPNRCILLNPPDMSLWMQGFLSRIDFAQFTATTQPLEVEALSADHMKESVLWEAGPPLDASAAVAVACVNILEQTANN